MSTSNDIVNQALFREIAEEMDLEIIRYIDGELPPERCLQVERMLECDPELAEEVRSTREALHGTSVGVPRRVEPVPDETESAAHHSLHTLSEVTASIVRCLCELVVPVGVSTLQASHDTGVLPRRTWQAEGIEGRHDVEEDGSLVVQLALEAPTLAGKLVRISLDQTS